MAAAPASSTARPVMALSAFSGVLPTSAADLITADAGAVHKRMHATVRERPTAASPTRPASLLGVSLADLDIPATAYIAYQVAATTMAQADPSCGVDWSLLAAIGRVESDHGRYGGAHLRPNGLSRPLIRGVALDGTGPVRMVRDSDAGRLDGDERWDRAVGPMQFLPSTWAYAGVDADGDGVRSPDDINDAALAAAVYLCAAPGSLTTPAGLRTAVHSYNASQDYVDLVERLAGAYRYDTFFEVPTGSTTLALGATFSGPADNARPDPASDGQAPAREPGTGNGQGQGDSDGTTDAHVKDPVQALPDAEVPQPLPDPEPTDGPSEQPSEEPSPGPSDSPSPGPTESPNPGPIESPTPTPEPAEEPAPSELSGVLGLVGDQWCLVDPVTSNKLALSVGDSTWLAAAALADHDVDGVVETNAEELTGLLGHVVAVGVEAGTDPAIVHTVNGAAYR
jgi:hypothetical protein